MSALEAMFEQEEPGCLPNLRHFLKEAAYKYEVGMGVYVRKPSNSIWEFMDRRVLASFFRLDMFKPMSKHVRGLFKSEKLRQLLEFPVLFLGATPQKTPALYSLMNHADLSLGTGNPWAVCMKLWLLWQSWQENLVFNLLLIRKSPVLKPRVRQQKTLSPVRMSTRQMPLLVQLITTIWISMCWTRPTATTANNIGKHAPWRRLVCCGTSGVNKRLKGLKHHNLFFDEDFGVHAQEIYESPQWPSKPLFYVSAPSVTDPLVAPEGCENLFVLIPVAPGLEDTPEVREKYFSVVMDRLEHLTDQKIRNGIVYKRAYAHADFVADYHAFKGNAYGLANTLMCNAFLKPALKNRHLKNLWYAQLTVPGPGVPPALISGQVVAAEIAKSIG